MTHATIMTTFTLLALVLLGLTRPSLVHGVETTTITTFDDAQCTVPTTSTVYPAASLPTGVCTSYGTPVPLTIGGGITQSSLQVWTHVEQCEAVTGGTRTWLSYHYSEAACQASMACYRAGTCPFGNSDYDLNAEVLTATVCELILYGINGTDVTGKYRKARCSDPAAVSSSTGGSGASVSSTGGSVGPAASSTGSGPTPAWSTGGNDAGRGASVGLFELVAMMVTAVLGLNAMTIA